MKPFTEEERYNYDLTPDSIVIDAGAYHGQFSRKLWDKYKCRIFAFEPINEFFQIAQQTLVGTTVSLVKAGFGGSAEVMDFGVANDSTGAFKEDAPKQRVIVLCAQTIIESLPYRCALLKLNIEGSEYGVLEDLIATGAHLDIENIQVQFHRCGPWADASVNSITSRLSETHHLTYDAGPYIWQNWELNDALR